MAEIQTAIYRNLDFEAVENIAVIFAEENKDLSAIARALLDLS